MVQEPKSTHQSTGLEALMGEKSHRLMDLHPRGQNIYQASSEKRFYSWLAVRGPVFLDEGFIRMPVFDDTEGLKLYYCTSYILAG